MALPPAYDRDQLAAAVNSVEISTNMTDMQWDDLMSIVCDAARKHLETLPKPVWRVTGWLPASTNRAAPYETTSRKEALDFARGYLEQGMVHVSVYQVPA